MFDAYTVKKVLPRLVIAIVLIQLSWFLFTGLISITNIVAYGIESLIYAPFGGYGQLEDFGYILSALNAPFGGNGFFVGIAAIGAIGGAAALGLVGILSLALTAILGLLIGFAVLALRQAIILGLLLISPIAIVAWILPGTQKFWKLWWESFSKLLLMFPMIIGLIAAGRVFAFVAAQAQVGDGAIQGIGGIVDLFIVVLGVFGPFFLIPKTFQLAGTAFGSITGMVNDRSRGAFDRLKKGRQERTAQNFQNFKTGKRFNDRNALSRGVNTLGRRSAAGFGGRFGFGARGKSVLDAQQSLAGMELEKSNPIYAANKDDDKVMTLLALNRNRTAAQDWINKNVAEGDRAAWSQSLESASAIGFNQTSRRAALMNGATLSYGLNAGEQGWAQAMNAAAELTGSTATPYRLGDDGQYHLDEAGNEAASQNLAYRNMMNQFQYVAKQVGRADLSGNTDGGAYNGNRAWNSVNLYTHGNSKPTDIKGTAAYFEQLLGRSTNPANMTKQDISNFANLNDNEKARFSSGQMSADEVLAVQTRATEGAKRASAVFLNELETVGSNATGATRNEALAQREKILGSAPADVSLLMNDPGVRQATRGYMPVDETVRRQAAGET